MIFFRNGIPKDYVKYTTINTEIIFKMVNRYLPKLSSKYFSNIWLFDRRMSKEKICAKRLFELAIRLFILRVCVHYLL